MRHRKKGRQLGRSSSHKKAMLKNLATSLILTEREDEEYDDQFQADGTTPVNPPKYKGRVVTTLQKAKEVRSMVEKCVTIARNALKHDEKAAEFEVDAERDTPEWEAWRKSDRWREWADARAPGVAARRRVYDILQSKEAVQILFEDIAPRFEDRPGGYTRILRLAKPRLGDGGTRAILEFVGRFERTEQSSEMPEFDVEDESVDGQADEANEDNQVEETVAETAPEIAEDAVDEVQAEADSADAAEEDSADEESSSEEDEEKKD